MKQVLSLVFLIFLSLNVAGKDTLQPPVFSHESGFYAKEFKLTLSHPDKNVTIYYTLDGSEPDPSNLNGKTFRYKNEYAHPPKAMPIDKFLFQKYKTYQYKKSIKIVDRTYEPDRLSQISTSFDKKPNYFPKPIQGEIKDGSFNTVAIWLNKQINKYNHVRNRASRKWHKIKTGIVKPLGNRQYIQLIDLQREKDKYLYKGTPVRAIAVNGSGLSSAVLSKIFFIGDQEQFSLPIINITVPEKDLFDYDEGIFVAGQKYDSWIESLKDNEAPTWLGDWQGNFKAKGKQKKAFVNVLNSSIEGEIVLGIHGNGSRYFPQTPIRIYAPEKLPDFFSGDKRVSQHRYVLRNGGQQQASKTRYLDSALQASIENLNVGVQRHAQYNVFINGEYYGLMSLADRRDHYYIQKHYQLTDTNIDLIKGPQIVQRGDDIKVNELLSLIRNGNYGNDFYIAFKQIVDLKSFFDYYASEIFFANTDWPGNNVSYWRFRGKNNTKNNYTDGKWRWFVYDLDQAGNDEGTKENAKFDSLSFATQKGTWEWPNPDWSTVILRNAIKNPRLENEFVTRFSDLLNSNFVTSRMVENIQHTHDSMQYDISRHVDRWGIPVSKTAWSRYTSDFIEFFEYRPQYQWQHLQDFFKLSGRYSLNVDISQQGAGKIKVNTLVVGDDPDMEYKITDVPLFLPWSGEYFQELPLTLEVVPAVGYKFSYWEINGVDLSDEEKYQSRLVLKPTQNISIKAVMVPQA